MVADCYQRRQITQKMNSNAEDSKLPNFFGAKLSDYEYFQDIYVRWKEKRGRKKHIIMQQAETKPKTLLRQNDSYSSLHSAKSGQGIGKKRSGFFASNAHESPRNTGNDTSFNNENSVKTPDRVRPWPNRLMQTSTFGADPKEELVSDSDESDSSESEVTFDDDVDKITIEEDNLLNRPSNEDAPSDGSQSQEDSKSDI